MTRTGTAITSSPGSTSASSAGTGHCPRDDELGAFGLLMSRFRIGNPRLVDGFDGALRALGEGPVLDLAYALEDGGELKDLLALDVSQALAALWSRLKPLAGAARG